MLQRVLEPEVMDTPDEARDYDSMDHASVNAKFCDDFLEFANRDGRQALGTRATRLVDFGTGTAQIPIALCARAAGFTVVAIDLAENMLALARDNVARAGLRDRVLLQRVDAKRTPFEDGAFGATISNSIVHHIPEPPSAVAEMWRVTAPGGLLFVRDLHRPETEGEVDRLVARYGGTTPAEPALVPSFEHQRALFRASLCAALTVAEVVAMFAPLGIPAAAVTMTSDRHWTIAHEKP
ncbi:class I SAM-dependent methyltransferase [soil metagenome]